jgi:hypothetical protein
MYIKNLNILKKKSPNIYNLVRSVEFKENILFSAEYKKNRIDIYCGDESNKIYITSKEHRRIEAKILVDDLLEAGHDEIIMFGAGNEVILNELTKRVGPHIKLHIIEFREVFKLLMDNVSLSKVSFERISSLTLVGESPDMRAAFDRLIAKSNMNTKVFVLPQYTRHLHNQVEAFTTAFKEVVSAKKSLMNVNLNYQKLWIYNSIINCKHVISTPKFLALKEYDFKDSIALIVGAGPSLSYEFERLRELSKNDNVYIFSIGSAYKALSKQGIKSDMLFSYDPTPLNKDVLSEYFEQKYDYPICFGSSIGYESIVKLNYEKAYHILTSQDYFSNYLLEGRNSEIVSDAPSIVVIALQALLKIGFKNIGFVGQNLAYIDEKNYADGINYERTANKKFRSNLTVKNVFGIDVYTNDGYLRTKKIIESVIKQVNDTHFFNTTYAGAEIVGAPYIPMNEVDFSVYKKRQSLDLDLSVNDYDLEAASKRFNHLKEERLEFRKVLLEGFKALIEIDEMLKSGKVKNADLIFKMQDLYNSLCDMDYFKILMSKMDRSYINIFESGIIEINRERNLVKKYELLYKRMGTVLTLFKRDDEKVHELFEYLTKWKVWE